MIKKIYGYWLRFLVAVFGIDFAKTFDAYLRFKRKLNLKNPQTLADKVTYLFLHQSTPLMSACTDKWEVRRYVAQKGLEDILIPTVGGPWSSWEEIDFNTLPERFIFKATHGCKMNYIVPDKAHLDKAACKRALTEWLHTTYGTYSLEPQYKTIPHRIYAETLLDAPQGLVDYKFHCCNGVPQFVLVCSERNAKGKSMQVKLDLFDAHWKSLHQYLRASGLEIPNTGKMLPPKQLGKMLSVCAILAKDFPFVRVDLYEQNGKVLFGELTFSPACGAFPNFTDELIVQMGQKLHI